MELDLNIVIFVLLLVIIILTAWIIRMELRLNKLLRGKDGRSLESSILQALNGVSELHQRKNDILAQVDQIDNRLKKSIRGIETMRFNPFGGVGGNQSFATALLDDEGNGVVLSSIYTREKVSVFAKPVVNYRSEYELSDEERAVLERSRTR